MPNTTDEWLVKRFCEEDERPALGELYQRYAHLVVGLCLDYLKDREVARDATMEIFERVTNKVCNRPPDSFRAWLFYVSRNYCIDLIRKRVRTAEVGLEKISTEPVEFSDDERPLSEERLERLPAALAQLPVAQARCIKLFYLQGLSYAGVAEATGYDGKQVKSYLQNGRRNLRIALQELTDG